MDTLGKYCRKFAFFARTSSIICHLRSYKRANNLLVDYYILARLRRDMARMCHLVTHRLSAAYLASSLIDWSWRDNLCGVCVARDARGVRTAWFANIQYIVSHCNGNCSMIGAQPTCQYALSIGSTNSPILFVDSLRTLNCPLTKCTVLCSFYTHIALDARQRF